MRALAAGADALCLGADIEARHVEETCGAIVEAVRSGRLAEERLREAAGRVRAVAAWTSGGGGGADRRVGTEAARRVVEAEGDVRLTGSPLVVELRPEANVAAGEAVYGFGDALRRRLPETEVLRFDEPPGKLASTGALW